MIALQKSPMMAAMCGGDTPPVLPAGVDILQVPVEQRIASVMPMMINLVASWWSRLRPREQAAADPEDLLTIIWIELREKDHSFDPARGYKYITWAATVARHKLGEQRNFLRVVHSPRNAAGRLQGHTCSESTANRVQTSMREPASIDSAASFPGDSSLLAVDSDPLGDKEATIHRVQCAVSRLPIASQARVIRLSYGLGGGTPMRPIDIARIMDIDPAEVARLKGLAEQRLADLMASVDQDLADDEGDDDLSEVLLD